jgi:hypothetical protein
MKITKQCICGNEYTTTDGRLKDGRGKFCSKKCQYTHAYRPSGLTYNIKVENKGWFNKGFEPWCKGKLLKKWDEYSKDLSYKHKVLRKMYGTPQTCEQCGTTENLQWSNKSGEYKEDRNDWQSLCAKHHQHYDYEHFGARQSFYNSQTTTI